MKETPTSISKKEQVSLYERIRQILESARTNIARTVNTTQVVANWLIGREIVEEEQRGRHRADYGKQLVEELSLRLQDDFGKGNSALNLWLFRRFYLEYPRLTYSKILYALRKESDISEGSAAVSGEPVANEELTNKWRGPALRQFKVLFGPFFVLKFLKHQKY